MSVEPGSVPESVLLCPGCGWQLATADGYCLDCSPVDDSDTWDDE